MGWFGGKPIIFGNIYVDRSEKWTKLKVPQQKRPFLLRRLTISFLFRHAEFVISWISVGHMPRDCCKCKVSTQHWMILTKAARLPTMSRETVEPPGDGDGTPPSQRELSFVLEGVGSSMMVYCLGGCQFHIYFVGPNIPWLQILRLQVDKAFLQCHLWQMRLICHSALSWE